MTSKNHCCYKKQRSKFKPVTHVIFDLDGTLIDSQRVYGEALQVTVEAYGLPYSTDLVHKISGSNHQDIATNIIQFLNIKTTNQEFLKIFDENMSKKKLGDLDLLPGAERLVRHLSNNRIPIAIATSSRQTSFDLKTKKHEDLISLFSHVVCGGSDPEVKVGKPAPDIFLICASRFSDTPDPSKCLVFEDSENGVQAAVAAGMQVVMTPNESVPYEIWKLATLRLDSLEYMMPQLFGLPPLSILSYEQSEPLIQ